MKTDTKTDTKTQNRIWSCGVNLLRESLDKTPLPPSQAFPKNWVFPDKKHSAPLIGFNRNVFLDTKAPQKVVHGL